MKRLIRRMRCFCGYHSWFSPLPWHGLFATAWKRCKWCGVEEGNDLPLDEYQKLIDRAKEQ